MRDAFSRRRIATAMVLLLIQGVSFGLSRKDISVSLKEKRIRDLTSKGLILAFHVGLRNSSSSTCALSRYSYRVTINQKEYLRMPVSLETPIRIGAGEEILVALPVKITNELLFSAVGPVGEKASCDVIGDFIFEDRRNREEKVPFVFSGEFPIFKDPAVDFLPLQVKDLTVGGADLVFAFKFRNENNYELIVDAINYKLFLADALVLEGAVPGDKILPLNGEKEFSLPVLLDFFEIGNEIHDRLRQASAPCRFSGAMSVLSIWGRLVIPFEKTGSLSLIRPPD